MRIYNFASRNFKEIIRDTFSIIFSILLPLFLLVIFRQFDIPNEAFNIEQFTPSVLIFSFTFITLFTASLVAQDRSTALLTRLCTSPMKPYEYIAGYIMSIMPLVIIQNIIFFIAAIILGLNISVSILFTMLVSIIISVLYILLGILIGCIATTKSAPGISSIVVQLTAFTSGMYFPIETLGTVFKFICKILPFASTVEILKSVLNNNYDNILINIVIFIIYIIIILLGTIKIFNNRLTSDNK